jgi:hypothetical protein
VSDDRIALAISGRDFGFKGVDAIWNKGGHNQSVHGVSGVGDDNLIVVHKEGVVSYPPHSGVLTTFNIYVFTIDWGPLIEVLDGPLAKVFVFFIIVGVGVHICILLIGLRGVSDRGWVWYSSLKGFHLLRYLGVDGGEDCKELAVGLSAVGLSLW